MRNSRAWAGESGINILGLGADEDSKIRKYFHICCHGAGNKEHGLSLEAPDFTFLAPLEKINNDHYIPELMFPDQLHMIKKMAKSVAKYQTPFSYGAKMCYVGAHKSSVPKLSFGDGTMANRRLGEG